LSRASTSWLPFNKEDVDGRNKSGHDEWMFAISAYDRADSPATGGSNAWIGGRLPLKRST
jgi:hypothetical protein